MGTFVTETAQLSCTTDMVENLLRCFTIVDVRDHEIVSLVHLADPETKMPDAVLYIPRHNEAMQQALSAALS